jgi:hypothetical protein
MVKRFNKSHLKTGLTAYALKGSPVNQFDLAIFLYEESKLPPNVIEVYAWASVAAYQGIKNAEVLRAHIETELTAQQLQEAQKLAREYKTRYSGC